MDRSRRFDMSSQEILLSYLFSCFCFFILLLSCLASEFYYYSADYDFTKNSVKIINFEPSNFHTSPLFKQSSIVKTKDKVYLENSLLISSSVSNLKISVFVFSPGFSFFLGVSSSRQGNFINLPIGQIGMGSAQ